MQTSDPSLPPQDVPAHSETVPPVSPEADGRRSPVRVPRSDRPTIFLRIFLSHLLLLAGCFGAAVVLGNHLFAPGIRLYIVRNPLVILPVVLGLIGVAGLLAVWTSAAIALPIEEAAAALRKRDAATALRNVRFRRAPLEVHDLIAAVRGLFDREPKSADDLTDAAAATDEAAAPPESSETVPADTPAASKTLRDAVHVSVNVDTDFFIRGADDEAIRLTERESAAQLYGMHFLDVFCAPAHRLAMHGVVMDVLQRKGSLDAIAIPFTDDASGRTDILWTSMRVFEPNGGPAGFALHGTTTD